MAGTITSSGGVYCETEAEITTAVEALTLPATTDTVHVIPWKNGCMVFNSVRAA